MKKLLFYRYHYRLIPLAIIILYSTISFAADQLQQIQQAIKVKGAQWMAQENWLIKVKNFQSNLIYGIIIPIRLIHQPSSITN